MEPISDVFKACSNPIRWDILQLLKQRPFCVNALTGRLSVSQPAVSQHLKILEHAGLVRREKVGLQVHYSIVPERLAACIERLRTFIDETT